MMSAAAIPTQTPHPCKIDTIASVSPVLFNHWPTTTHSSGCSSSNPDEVTATVTDKKYLQCAQDKKTPTTTTTTTTTAAAAARTPEPTPTNVSLRRLHFTSYQHAISWYQQVMQGNSTAHCDQDHECLVLEVAQQRTHTAPTASPGPINKAAAAAPPPALTHAPTPTPRPMPPAINIIGGMGPAATLLFLSILDEITHAAAAAEKQSQRMVELNETPTLIPATVLMLTKIPDRTTVLKKGGLALKRAKLVLQEGYKLMQRLNPKQPVYITCNTAHALVVPDIMPHVNSMIKLTQSYCAELRLIRVICLGTDSTIELELYDGAAPEVMVPDARRQRIVMHSILAIKQRGCLSAQEEKDYVSVLTSLSEEHDTSAFILGCTELPIIARLPAVRSVVERLRFVLIDPMAVVARYVVNGRKNEEV